MNRPHTKTAIVIVSTLLGIILWGCSSSDESTKHQTQQSPPQPSATELMTTTVNTLKVQNDSLKLRISSLEQSNRSSVARAAELETQLNDLKSKPAPPPTRQTMKPATMDPDVTYENALHLFRSRNYQGSAEMLQHLLENSPSSDLADNYHYWLGECAYATKHYQEAIEHFQKVFDFKISEKKDDAQIMIAHSYYAMGDKGNAKKEYNKFLEKFPASPYAQRAKERLSKL
jgi:tol-pal system protein YbgF